MTGAEIGARILAARTARKWSLRRLRDKSGVSHGYIRQLEQGDVPRPGVERVLRLYRALDLDIAELGLPDSVIGDAEARYEVRGADEVELYTNMARLKEMDPDEYELIRRQILERVRKTEREIAEGIRLRNAKRRERKPPAELGEAD